MVTRTSSTRRTPAFSATQSSVQPSPTIKSIVVTDGNYVDLDDTAIGSTGGYIKLKGFGFTANSLVLFNGANVTNTYVSSTEYRAVIPATAAGSYNILLFKDNIGLAGDDLKTYKEALDDFEKGLKDGDFNEVIKKLELDRKQLQDKKAITMQNKLATKSAKI